MTPRFVRAVGTIAAALIFWLAVAPTPALAESVLSEPSVMPTSGTTETVFTFTVRYTSTDSPNRPAQAVWAEVDGVTVNLVKVSGTSHDGTWQGTSTLPSGTWPATFHATTSGDPQPAPLPGPTVTVTEPPPTPEPPPAPPSTAEPEPEPEPLPADESLAPPADEAGPLPAPRPPSPMLQPPPRPQSTAAPPNTGGPTVSASTLSTSDGSASGSAEPMARGWSPDPTSTDEDSPSETPEPFETAADDADPPPGSRLAALLLVGGSMSLGGAAVLARQWLVSRSRRR